MSSESDSASTSSSPSTPAGSAPSATPSNPAPASAPDSGAPDSGGSNTGASVEADQTATQSALPRPPVRMKIGSERPRSAAYQPKAVESAPATPAAPTPAPAPALAATDTPAPAAPAEAAPPTGAPDRPARGEGHGRDRRGGDRPQRKPPEILTAPVTVPKPNLREKLSDDLEAELAEALGDKSLEEIIAGQSGGASVGEALLPESKVRGRVAKIHRDSVFLDLGGPNQGIIPVKQFGEKLPAEGDMIEVIIDGYNEAEGFYLCHKPGGAVASADWSQVNEGLVVEARVTGHNKGGLECAVGSSLRGFIPASQISMFRIENFEELVGQKFNCVITECNPEKRNLVLSRRAVLEREKEEGRAQTMKELAVGQVREGIVRNIRDFGAFVDIGGVDGLLHVGQLSWARIKHPSDLLTVGQKVQVKIQKIDPESQKISLTMRELAESPWANVEEKFYVGAQLSGKVTKIMQFGAFVELEPGVEGMVHISELAHQRVFRVSDVVKEGQQVDVKVLQVDKEKQRISLSLKATLARPISAKDAAPEPEPEEPETPAAPPKRNVPLKGGLGKASGGESVGLNW